jgi:phage terminase small subunit
MKITAKQQKFADCILAGNTGSDSYRKAYSTKGDNRSVARRAVELMANPKVEEYLAGVRAKLKKVTILDKQRSLEALTEIANAKKEQLTRDRIAAIKQISRMQGFDAPTKIEAKIQGSLLDQIRRGKA